MEKTEQNGASSPRRRRRRGSGRGGAQAAAQQAQRAPQAAAEKPAQKENKKAARTPAPRKEEPAQPARSRHRGQAKKAEAQGSSHAAARSANPPAREPKLAHVPGNRHTARGNHAARRPEEDDPGLVLITRRPPKQKFANFEEYLAAHGGMTLPLPEEERAAGPDAPVAGE